MSFNPAHCGRATELCRSVPSVVPCGTRRADQLTGLEPGSNGAFNRKVMGIEYEAVNGKVLPSDSTRAALQGLVACGRWVALASSANKLVLRDTTQPQRDRWPEDVEVEVDGRRVYVLFHSGRSEDRAAFLRELSGQYQAVGIALGFHEL